MTKESLQKRPDKSKFIDSIVFGTILNKNQNLEKYKNIIKDKFHKICWHRKWVYITIKAEDLK